MKIPKKNWSTTTFGEVAIQQKADIDRNSDVVDLYVAGEHMNSEDLHIRQWGIFNGQYLGPAFRRKFEKGDILYGSRRTYLKKVAVADFDGITANTTFVIKPNREVIYASLLPFLMLSDLFSEHSIKHSKGSVNPYINWKDIADFTFKLPSMDEQKRIAVLLWSIDDAVEKKLLLKVSINNLYLSSLEQIYGPKGSGAKRKIDYVCKVNANNLSANTDPNYRFQYLDIASILAPNKLGDLKEYYFREAPSRARRVVSPKSLVISLVRPYFQSFVIIENDVKDLIASTGTAVLDVLDGVDYRFVFHSFFTKHFLSFCEQRMNGTNYPAITPNDLKNYELRVPSRKEQCEAGQKLSALKDIEDELSSEIGQLSEIKKQIINQIFG